MLATTHPHVHTAHMSSMLPKPDCSCTNVESLQALVHALSTGDAVYHLAVDAAMQQASWGM